MTHRFLAVIATVLIAWVPTSTLAKKPTPVKNIPALNAQLQQAVSAQNWSLAIRVVDQMIVAAPKQRSQLTSYKTDLQRLQKSTMGQPLTTSIANPAAVNPSTPLTSPQAVLPASKLPTLQPASSKQQFPPELSQAFLASCTDKGAPQAYCACFLKGIEQRYNAAELIKVAGQLQARQVPPEFVTIANSCFAKLP